MFDMVETGNFKVLFDTSQISEIYRVNQSIFHKGDIYGELKTSNRTDI
jgi:hypothetical protein